MSKADGFSTADIAVGHLDDDKVRKLWRILGPDQAAMTSAIATHLAVVLSSWSSGRRKVVDESLPLWLTPTDEVLAALVSSGLLDAEHRVPVRSWRRHYGPAAERKAARSEAARLAGIRSGQARAKGPGTNVERPFNDRERLPNPSGRQAGPSVPTESVRPSRGARARGGGARSPGEIMREAGGFAADLAARGTDR